MPNSKVSSCEDDPSILMHQITFTPIDEIIRMPTNMDVDLLGNFFLVQETSTIKRKDGKEVPRCTITMLDMSCTTIDITLWGAIAE